MKKILSIIIVGLLCISVFAAVLPQADARPTPEISVTTTTDKISAQAGDVVTYTFKVTNTGGVTLFGVSVAVTLTGTATKQTESKRTNDKLETGENWVFTATYTVQASDLDPLVSTATATAYTRKGDAYTAVDVHTVYLYGAGSDLLPDVLTSPNQEPNGGWYGCSVAIGEGVIVVGAAYESVPIVVAAGKPAPAPTEYYGAGRVYVYSATTGALLNTLESPNAVDYGWFGYSVAVGDGVIVVGAPRETSGAVASAGNAYVYSATTRAYIATLTSATPVSDTNGQGYGISVAVNNGIIAVGSSREKVGTIANAGKVYLYDAVTNTPKSFSPLTSQDPVELGRFGWSVAVGEGVIVVGAPYEYIVGIGGYAGPAGRVYTYVATTGALIDTVTSPNEEFYGGFGSSVAVGDGKAVIGARGETVSGYDEAGRAYIYNLATETIAHTLTSQNSQIRGLFGDSVAVGAGVVVVGAVIENSTNIYPDAGAAYVFNAGTGAYVETLTNLSPADWTEFGWSVAVNDLNGVIAVGAYDAVFLFE